jgi:hypothetical protein
MPSTVQQDSERWCDADGVIRVYDYSSNDDDDKIRVVKDSYAEKEKGDLTREIQFLRRDILTLMKNFDRNLPKNK